ncbi:MAG: molybdopterin-dependent oxidoreductase [Steroidobacteraceae bacterium]
MNAKVDLPTTAREAVSFCRICSGMCGILMTIDENDRVLKVRGDPEHATSQGFVCIKGLQIEESYHGKTRLLRSLKNRGDGTFEEIDAEQALDEIAAKMRVIIDESGPGSVAVYRGGGSFLQALAFQMHVDWLKAIGSKSMFSNSTIDQSAKWVTSDRLGMWDAGKDHFYNSDVIMIIGGNPLVSIGIAGFEMFNPVKKLKAARERGLKLIIIDPRHSDIAKHADVHLQLRPGEDPTVAAGLLRLILSEGWHDKEFCARHVSQLDALRAAVEPFTPDYVQRRAGIAPGQLRAAAELFARTSKRGFATTSTGACMAPRSNLSDHLYECLNVICGRYLRAGEPIPNPGAFQRPRVRRAEVIAPKRQWETNDISPGGNPLINGQRMTARLADEILMPGQNRVRALINDGGNPASSWPDQKKTVKALRALDLLVTIDPFMSTTASLSTYILAPKMQYEIANIGNCNRSYEPNVSLVPLQQYSPPILRTPPGSQLVEDWYVFWALAKRLKVQLVFDGVALNMEQAPSTEEMLEVYARGCNVSLDEVKKYPHGKVFPLRQLVEPPRPETNARFQVAPDDIVADLTKVAAEPFGALTEQAGRTYTHRLIVRRMREFMNSACQNLSAPKKRIPQNPAFMHPEDMRALGIAEGDAVTLRSEHGEVTGHAEADTTIQPGVVSMTHAWGAYPARGTDVLGSGGCTNLLVATDCYTEVENKMVRMTAIPVNISRAAG